jgi:TIM-barrel protein
MLRNSAYFCEVLQLGRIKFDLNIGNVKIPNPIILASMAGITSSSFAIPLNVGLAMLGGYNIDDATVEVAKSLIERGRNEFAYEDPEAIIKNELGVMKSSGKKAGINVRSTSLEPVLRIAELVREKGAVLELNAHCRQSEMKKIGAGEAMMLDLTKLTEWIREIKETDVALSVKVRAGIVNDVELVKAIDRAGADVIHIDTMDFESKIIKKVRDSTSIKIIANNSIVDYNSAYKMFSMGADFVSVARAALQGASALEDILVGTEQLQDLTGWYNAPKHICAGGDLRGLTFCCMPIKECPLHYVLKRAGISRERYIEIKESFMDTKLGGGDNTCFGSMVWCCKITRPCPWRDSTLQDVNLSDVEYMKVKKQLAEKIMNSRGNL